MSAGDADVMTPAEREVARALGRAGIYRLLAGAFAYPVAWRFQELAHVATMAADAPTTPAGLREPLGRLAAAAREANPDAVAEEHVFLFDRQVRCPPYEGAYGAARELAGKAAQLADIAGFYAAFGMTAATAQPDVEDHVAAELEFMSVLALKEAYALGERHAEGLEVTRRAQVAFLTDHLGRWAEAFAAEVQAATPIAFYGAAAELLAAWVRTDVGLVGATPSRATAALQHGPGGEDAFTCPMAEAGGDERVDR